MLVLVSGQLWPLNEQVNIGQPRQVAGHFIDGAQDAAVDLVWEKEEVPAPTGDVPEELDAEAYDSDIP